jgi:hypothetical protein
MASKTVIIKFYRIGVGISNTDVEYADSTSSSTAPTSGWQTNAPAWQNGHYIWTRTHIYYTNGNEKLSEPVCLPSGKGVAKIEEWYYLSSSATSLAGGSWVKNKAPTWKNGYYIWTKSVITYTDGTSSSTSPICTAGNKGDKGDKGERGKYMNGPQDWKSLPEGFTFYPLENNEVVFFDTIEYEGEYYECNKKHTKNSSVTPLSDYKTYGGKGNWKLGTRFSMVAAKILLTQYALVKNLGVETIDMKDADGNIIFQAKDGEVTCNKGTFNNIKVTGDSEFSGTMKAVSGSFKSLNCVDNSGKVVGNITFGSDGRMWFDGDMYSQGYRDDKKRNNRFYASDILCRGVFGHLEKITAVVKGTYMYVYSKGADRPGTYVSLKTGTTSNNKTFYYIPLYSPSNTDDLSGLPIDVVVFNTSSDYYYAFSGMRNGKEWRVINGNNNQTVHFCDVGGWHSLLGGASVNCMYVNPAWLNPVPGTSDIGRGVFWAGETDLNW